MMKRPTLILMLCTLVGFSSSPLFARPWNWQRDLDIELRYSLGYDSNILEMSDQDITRYEDNLLPGTTDIVTYDDFVQNGAVRFRITSPGYLGNRKTRVYYTIGYTSHGNNTYNDRVTHSIFFTQDITRKIDLLGSYFIMPSKYLRDYFDRDWQQILPTEFDYYQSSLGFRWQVTDKFRAEARYEGYQVYYNKWFTEYDTESDGFMLSGQYKLRDNLTLNAEFRKRWADNVGYADITEFVSSDPIADAEYGDGSYGEEYTQYGITWDTPEFLNREWTIDLSHRIRHRYYTSDLPLEQDPFHRGRQHWHQRLFLTIDTQISGRLSGGPEFEYEWRRTDAPLDVVAERKDFDLFRASVQFRYTLW